MMQLTSLGLGLGLGKTSDNHLYIVSQEEQVWYGWCMVSYHTIPYECERLRELFHAELCGMVPYARKLDSITPESGEGLQVR
jgi:hypothetical protein